MIEPRKKVGVLLACVLLIIGSGCKKSWPDEKNAPSKELSAVLMALQWKPKPPDVDAGSSENPGWYNPTNREALSQFIANHPDTEDAYLAEVWLIFAKADIDRTWSMAETRRRRAADAEALKRIIARTTSPGTSKIARILRACELAAAEENTELQNQTNEILSGIKEYEFEKDPQFLRFLEVEGTPLREIEPYLRRALIISECHQHHLEKALLLAQDLQKRFPAWSKRELIHSDIYMLKQGKSPYPTWNELRDVGRKRAKSP